MPNHFSDPPSLTDALNSDRHSNSQHYCNSVFHTSGGSSSSSSDTKSDAGSEALSENPPPLHRASHSHSTPASVFVVVKGARNRRAPMFPNFSLFEWVSVIPTARVRA